jgi:hypothetical protein
MNDIEENRIALVSALETRGWFWENETLIAPNRTMWFSDFDCWVTDIADFHQRMKQRRDRIVRNREYHTDKRQHQNTVDDVEGLMCLIAELIAEKQNRS